jgi:hypothetical protein
MCGGRMPLTIDKALGVAESTVVVNVHINGAVELAARWEIAQHLS